MRSTAEWMAETMHPIIDRIAGGKMSKHTPGPWGPHKHALAAVISGTGMLVANCGSHMDNMRDPDELIAEQEANARLIAAAPDLYGELVQADTQMQMAYECVEAGRYDEALLHLGAMSRTRRAAIAKAEGKTK